MSRRANKHTLARRDWLLQLFPRLKLHQQTQVDWDRGRPARQRAGGAQPFTTNPTRTFNVDVHVNVGYSSTSPWRRRS